MRWRIFRLFFIHTFNFTRLHVHYLFDTQRERTVSRICLHVRVHVDSSSEFFSCSFSCDSHYKYNAAQNALQGKSERRVGSDSHGSTRDAPLLERRRRLRLPHPSRIGIRGYPHARKSLLRWQR